MSNTCPKCSSANVHQGQNGSLRCWDCGAIEGARATCPRCGRPAHETVECDDGIVFASRLPYPYFPSAPSRISTPSLADMPAEVQAEAERFNRMIDAYEKSVSKPAPDHTAERIAELRAESHLMDHEREELRKLNRSDEIGCSDCGADTPNDCVCPSKPAPQPEPPRCPICNGTDADCSWEPGDEYCAEFPIPPEYRGDPKPSERPADARDEAAARQETFGEWWFIRGGGIHGAWKRRRYSQILDYAMNLPRDAWQAGWDAALEWKERK